MKTEIWKDIPGYEGHYQASDLGNIKSISRKIIFGKITYISKEKLLAFTTTKNGYYSVTLSKYSKIKTFQVHLLITLTFLNHTDWSHKLVVNHINFNRLDNRVINLEIITARENTNLKHKKHSSQYTGVYWSKQMNKWRASIQIKGKQTHLGYFDIEEKASECYENIVKSIK